MSPLALVSGHVSVKTSVAATGGFRPKADVRPVKYFVLQNSIKFLENILRYQDVVVVAALNISAAADPLPLCCFRPSSYSARNRAIRC